MLNITDIGNLFERIEDFTFRNVGGIKIPKNRRSVAYHMSVDVIIESIDWNLYESDKSIPKTQFYGYATLTLNDCLSQPIPLTFPRTRIYSEWQWQAFQSWQDELLFWQQYQLHRKNDISLAAIMGSLDIPYEDTDPILKPFSWKELPLREVRIRCPINTQFTIEYTQVEPIPYTDIFGNFRDGSSQAEDGKKDDGLPEEGIQPKRNDRNNPFGGNKPALGAPIGSGFSLPVSEEEDPTSNIDPNVGAEISCRVVIRTFLTAPEANAGNIASTATFEDVILPSGDFLVVERYDDPTSFTGFSDAVKLNIRGDYYLGGNSFSATRSRWSQRNVTIEAVCVAV